MLQPPPRPEKIDEKVIDGHVIPKEVLFTNAAQEDVEHETLAFTDMLKVTISFKTETSNKGSKSEYNLVHFYSLFRFITIAIE